MFSMLRFFSVVFATILVVWGGFQTPPALAQESCAEPVGQWPQGPAGVVSVSGDFAYLGKGRVLQIVDVSDPVMPEVVAQISFPDIVSGVAVSGDYAYVLFGGFAVCDRMNQDSGLSIIDVSTPSSPNEVGSSDGYFWSLMYPAGIAVSGDFVFVVHGQMLNVIDASAPSSLVLAGGIQMPTFAEDVAVSGTFAYVADGDAGLRIIRVGSGSTVEVGHVDGLQHANAVAVSGGFAYVADDAGLGIFDVSTPAAPIEVGRVDDLRQGKAVAVSNGFAYVAGDGGLRIFNVSTPAAPVAAGFYDSGSASGVAVLGSHAYLAAERAGLRIIDISTPESPAETGFLMDSSSPVGALAVSGGYAYGVSKNGGRFHVIDVSQPAAPIETGSCAISVDSPQSVAVSGGYAYVAAGTAGLRVIDIRSPSSPIEVGFNESLDAFDVAVSGNYAFVTDFREGLRIFDVTTPDSPVEVAAYPTPRAALGVDLSCGFAYVVNRAEPPGLLIIDVSTPNSPTEVSFHQTPGGSGWESYVYDVAVSGGYAYLACYRGMRVIDVSVPGSPRQVGFFETNAPLDRVEVEGNLAFLRDQNYGLRVIDVSAPGSPREVCSYQSCFEGMTWFGPPNDLAVADGYVYLAISRDFLPPELGYIAAIDILRSSAAECTPIHIAAAASGVGLGNSVWATDLGINNRGNEPLTYAFQFLPRGADNTNASFTEEFTVAPNTAVNFVDIWKRFTGVDGAGGINVCVSSPNVAGVVSRTYNTSDRGTFGQSIVGVEGLVSEKLIPSGERARLGFLTENSDFRTNIGFMNTSACDTTLHVEFFTAGGASLGTRSIDLPPFSNNQWTQAFAKVTDDDVDLGYADVWSDTVGAAFLTYASVIDNNTSDPTTIWPFDTSAVVNGGTFDCTPVWVAAAASTPGTGGTLWATDLGINNLSTDSLTYRFQLLPRGRDNTGVAMSDPFNLAGNASVAYSDIWQSLTGADGAGAINVCIDNGSAAGVISRTYNTGDEGTFGQSIVGIRGAASAKVGTAGKARLGCLFENASYRTNIGFMNASANEITISAEFFDMLGNSLGIKNITLAPFSNAQWNSAFTLDPIFADDIAAGFVDVWTGTAGAAFLTYASIVDNGTGDPTTIWPF